MVTINEKTSKPEYYEWWSLSHHLTAPHTNNQITQDFNFIGCQKTRQVDCTPLLFFNTKPVQLTSRLASHSKPREVSLLIMTFILQMLWPLGGIYAWQITGFQSLEYMVGNWFLVQPGKFSLVGLRRPPKIPPILSCHWKAQTTLVTHDVFV